MLQASRRYLSYSVYMNHLLLNDAWTFSLTEILSYSVQVLWFLPKGEINNASQYHPPKRFHF